MTYTFAVFVAVFVLIALGIVLFFFLREWRRSTPDLYKKGLPTVWSFYPIKGYTEFYELEALKTDSGRYLVRVLPRDVPDDAPPEVIEEAMKPITAVVSQRIGLSRGSHSKNRQTVLYRPNHIKDLTPEMRDLLHTSVTKDTVIQNILTEVKESFRAHTEFSFNMAGGEMTERMQKQFDQFINMLIEKPELLDKVMQAKKMAEEPKRNI